MWRIIYSTLSGVFAIAVLSVALTFLLQPAPEDFGLHVTLALAAIMGGIAVGLSTSRGIKPR